MKICILQRQRAVSVQRKALRALAQRLLKKAFAKKPLPFETLWLILVNDKAMPTYKERTFGLLLQTDVITQTYEAIPGVQAATAEVILNIERAQQEGARRPGGVAHEIAFYLAHGLDHLAGHEDHTPARRRTMHQRATAWLEAESGPDGWPALCP